MAMSRTLWFAGCSFTFMNNDHNTMARMMLYGCASKCCKWGILYAAMIH